jgi:hypothetical protein
MGIETKDVNAAFELSDPTEALAGSLGGSTKGSVTGYPKEAVFRVFVGCLNEPDKRAEYETILTRSFNCQNVLKNSGDLAIHVLQGTFDKDGYYHVAVRYIYLP